MTPEALSTDTGKDIFDYNSVIGKGHNPDHSCLACCLASERLNGFLDTLEGLLAKVTDPNAIDELPPVLKMASKFIH